jgi:hypothetical protein
MGSEKKTTTEESMAMSNGTQQQQQARMKFKPRTSSLENHPDAPEGGWEFTIPKGKCKVSTTQKGDPQVAIPHKLVKAMDEHNESFQGAEVMQRYIAFDETTAEGKKNSNMQKDRLRQLCAAVDLEFADVFPTEIDEKHPDGSYGFRKLIAALEGVTGQCWTVHRSSMRDSGEVTVNTNVVYREPGAGLVTRSEDTGDDDERPGKKASKKGSRR